MATLSHTQDNLSGPVAELDIGDWLRTSVFNSVSNTLTALVLIIANILIIRIGFNAAPVSLSVDLAPNGNPTAMGNLIRALTNGPFLTSLLLVLWFIGAGLVLYGVARNRWIGPAQWLKDSLYHSPFGALVTLALSIGIVFVVRGILSWGIFGAEFRTNPDTVNLLRENNAIPGAIWGIIPANAAFFSVGLYDQEVIWRVWASVAIILALSVLTVLAWNFGAPLKNFQRQIVWGWIASYFVIMLLLLGTFWTNAAGPLQYVKTNDWGGFLLTMVLAITGIVLSFPIGVLAALGRRSEVRGVPYLWAIAAGLLLIYWGLGNYPQESVTFNIPVIFRDPPLWTFTVGPGFYALLQFILVVGTAWIISYYLKGNMIKTFSTIYIEAFRGVPFITVLFMAQVLLPIFLPKEIEINNLFRVIVGIILFTGAYMAENIRGGLQAIPKGQYEAAAAIGLSSAQSMRLIILPQAIRAVIPALVGMAISLFIDTSLVAIVGLLDFLRIAQSVIAQPDWLGLQRETFVFISLIYWIFAFAMSRASQRLEKNLGVGEY